MHKPNHNEEDFFDLIARPEGVVPKNFEASPPTLGQKLVKRFPSKHKNPAKAKEQERGLKNIVDFLIPQSKLDLGLTLAAGPIAKVAKSVKSASPLIEKGKRLFEKTYRERNVEEGSGVAYGTMPKDRAAATQLSQLFRAKGNPEKLRKYNIEYGIDNDVRAAHDIVVEAGEKIQVWRGNSKNFPKIEVNEKQFAQENITRHSLPTNSKRFTDNKHTVSQTTTSKIGKFLENNPKKEDVLFHEFTVQPKNAQKFKDDVAGLSFNTRRADDVTYIEDIRFGSGIRTRDNRIMGFSRKGLTNKEALEADRGAVKLLNQAFQRLPKNSVLILDSGKDNTVTREALTLLLNSAGKMAKRIILNQSGPTRVRVNYEGMGSGKGLDKLNQKQFAKLIIRNLEKAAKPGSSKVSGKAVIETDKVKNNWIKMSSIRIELAAAFGIPVSQLDSFMEQASEE